jgi:hypothetical protein
VPFEPGACNSGRFSEHSEIKTVSELIRATRPHTRPAILATKITEKIIMVMNQDQDDVVPKAGDVAVQRGTNRAWANRGTETWIIMFVLVNGVSTRDTDASVTKGIPARQASGHSTSPYWRSTAKIH